MINSSRKHLQDSRCSYFEHFKFAIYAGVLLLLAAIASLIHAIFPAIFKGSSAYIVIKLYKERLENHPNATYQDWIKNGANKSRNN